MSDRPTMIVHAGDKAPAAWTATDSDGDPITIYSNQPASGGGFMTAIGTGANRAVTFNSPTLAQANPVTFKLWTTDGHGETSANITISASVVDQAPTAGNFCVPALTGSAYSFFE